jgi:hypothetical protein
MTTPFERTRSLIGTKELLERLQDPKETPRVPPWLREEARQLLRHYPTYSSIELAHKVLPHVYGPVPPLSLRRNNAHLPTSSETHEPRPF